MKRKFLTLVTVISISGSVLFSSCIGSFALSNKVLDWNNTIGDKFINEVVFLVLSPVYVITAVADVLVINSIEFWTDSNPVLAGTVKKVQGEKGIYAIETLENGYEITDEAGNKVLLTLDKESKTWYATTNGESHKIITLEDEKNAIVHFPNGDEVRVDLSEQGVIAFKQTIENNLFLAVK